MAAVPIPEQPGVPPPSAAPARAAPRKADPPTPECPKCKGGAPAWMATFADMATLLMAFFVLILSFAEMNVPKYKQISGSMKMAFGVQRIVPTVEPPKAQSLIAQQFSPAVAQPTPVNTVQQQTTDATQPEVELMTDVSSSDFETNADYRVLQEALQKQIAEGQVKIRTKDDKIVVELQGNAPGQGKADGRQDASAALAGGVSATEQQQIFAQIAAAVTKMTATVEVTEKPLSQLEKTSSTGNPQQSKDEQLKRIKIDLAEEIQQGLAEVERDGERIIIRLGDQNGFVSGSAELQPRFARVLDQVGRTLADSDGRVTVEGHTDNVPIAFSDRFSSNWDLSSARSAAVADYMLNNTALQAGRVRVVGLADTRPIDSNDSVDGRARNRRIEVILD